MTVKEVFDLRKQGRIEEAYEAIRPMYATHKGRYTTLCMFWTDADVFKLRLEQGRVEEASKILEALKRMIPRVEEINKELDSERPTSTPIDKLFENSKPLPWEKGDAKTADEPNKAAAFIASATRRLAKAQKTEKKSSPVRATDYSRGCKPTVPATPTKFSILNSQFSISDAPTNPQLLHDYPGHLIVSLDEGIIRPIEGINAPQRVVLACITAHPGYSVPQISASTGIPAKSITSTSSTVLFLNSDEQTMDVTIETLDAQGNTLFSKTVNNVPFKRNRVTKLTGAMYTNSGVDGGFQISTDWLTEYNGQF